MRHLRHYHPDARLEVICKPQREDLYVGLADEVTGSPQLDRPPTHTVSWPLPDRSYASWPSTYVERCLIEQFDLEPVPELCRYQVAVRPDPRGAVRTWLATLRRARPKLALCNFRGAGMKPLKDVDDYAAAAIVRALNARDFDVLVWDVNDRTTLPAHGLGVHVPAVLDPPQSRLEHAATAAALIAECDLFVGVDSGPLHLAAAVGTRSIGIWTRQSPLHCISPHPNLAHACLIPTGVPEYERHFIHRPIEDGLAYFRANYDHVWTAELADGIAELLETDRPASREA